MKKFLVSIKIDDYCAQFEFNTESERDRFIQLTKEMTPKAQIFTNESNQALPKVLSA